MVFPSEHDALRRRVHDAVHGASWASKVAGVAGFAMLTGLLAQVEVYAPWNPYVPYTGQLLGVMAAGLVLGPGLGAASMGLYLLLGLFGLPVFADWGVGLVTLKGRTAGYLYGYPAAAWTTGRLMQHYGDEPGLRRLGQLGLWTVLAFMGVFAVGGLVLGFSEAFSIDGLGATVLVSSGFIVGVACVIWAFSRTGSYALMARIAAALAGSLVVFLPGAIVLKAVSGLSWADTVAFGVLQFLPVDLAKALLAAAVAGLVVPPPRGG